MLVEKSFAFLTFSLFSTIFCSENGKKEIFGNSGKEFRTNEKKLEPSPYRNTLESKRLSVKSLWNIYKTNLEEMVVGFEKMFDYIEKFTDHDVAIIFENTPGQTESYNGMLYVNLLHNKLSVEAMLRQDFSLRAQIPSVHYLQLQMTDLWTKTANFELGPNDQSAYESALVKNLVGHLDAEYEMSCCLKMDTILAKAIRFADEEILQGKENEKVFWIKRDLSILYQRSLIANIAIQSIRLKGGSKVEFSAKKSGELRMNYTSSDTGTISLSKIPGSQHLEDELININFSAGLLGFYIDHNKNLLANLDYSVSLNTVKMILCSDLKNFQKTGNPQTIVSRLILEVIEKRKETEKIMDYIITVSTATFATLDNLSYQEKTQKLISNKCLKLEPNYARKFKNEKVIKKKTKKKKTAKKYPNPPSKSTKKARQDRFKEEDVSHSDDDLSEAIIHQSLVVDPAMYFIMLGQGCYDFVLYPLLEELGMTEYTWKQVSEACYSAAGLRALATLNLTLSQVDVCIEAVRRRVPYAHPTENLDPEHIQDDLLTLSYEYPDLSGSFDRLRKGLSLVSQWNVVPGQSKKLRSKVSFERFKVVAAALRVGEFCWISVFEKAAASLGLNTETSSISQIIAQSTENVEMLIDCQTAIGLRNALVHQKVSPSEALEAARLIYADDQSQKLSVLESIFSNRVNRSEGGEFY